MILPFTLCFLQPRHFQSTAPFSPLIIGPGLDTHPTLPQGKRERKEWVHSDVPKKKHHIHQPLIKQVRSGESEQSLPKCCPPGAATPRRLISVVGMYESQDAMPPSPFHSLSLLDPALCVISNRPIPKLAESQVN